MTSNDVRRLAEEFTASPVRIKGVNLDIRVTTKRKPVFWSI